MATLIAVEYKQFEDIKHTDENGVEFWYARELSLVLDYTQWRNFSKVIDKAMLSCQNSGFECADHFVEVSKIVDAFNRLDEDNKRLVIRGEVSTWNAMLADAAHEAGITDQVEYAQFQNAGYMGLYGGLTAAD